MSAAEKALRDIVMWRIRCCSVCMTTKELVYKPAAALFLPTLCLTGLLQLLCAARGPASRSEQRGGAPRTRMPRRRVRVMEMSCLMFA